MKNLKIKYFSVFHCVLAAPHTKDSFVLLSLCVLRLPEDLELLQDQVDYGSMKAAVIHDRGVLFIYYSPNDLFRRLG